jgi:hypothetical protein
MVESFMRSSWFGYCFVRDERGRNALNLFASRNKRIRRYFAGHWATATADGEELCSDVTSNREAATANGEGYLSYVTGDRAAAATTAGKGFVCRYVARHCAAGTANQ